MNSILKSAFVFIAGAGAGLAAGYLTAPREGAKSRQRINKEYDSMKKSLETAATSKLEEAREILNKTVETQAQKGKKVIDKAKEVATL